MNKYETVRGPTAVANTCIAIPEQNFVQRKCSHCAEEEKKEITAKTNFTKHIQQISRKRRSGDHSY
jgi:type II secretory ATPase GspE/PulE/Tfp pilus assembly ATPase PilB-like protein